MTRIIQDQAIKGSQKWMQVVVNEYPHLLNVNLQAKMQLNDHDDIKWLSPLSGDRHAEYRDNDLLKVLDIKLPNRSLDDFWPRGGPVWDGLAKSGSGDIILVEAKSHISEMRSSCQACDQSLEQIQNSLKEAARFYGASSPSNWTKGYYQYANRLAYLYFLRNLNEIPAWLVFVYFVNDIDMNGPKSEDEWKLAIADIHNHLGVKSEDLRPYVIDVFVDVANQFSR